MLSGETSQFTQQKISAQIPIGNVLDIRLRQASASSLPWVELDDSGENIAITPPKDTPAGIYLLELESYDQNSGNFAQLAAYEKDSFTVFNTLKTDTIMIFVDPPLEINIEFDLSSKYQNAAFDTNDSV